MIPYSTGVQPPRTAEDFEDVCHIIYSELFDDPTATKNGRSGQKQDGVDIFAMRNEKRYGIQCKRKKFGSLTTKIIDDEVKLADAGKVKIEELIIATTGPNDVAMVEYAANLSDARRAESKFRVSVAFWDTLETYIRRFPRLQTILAPQMPGGAFWEQRQAFAEQKLSFEQLTGEVRAVLRSPDSLARGIPDAQANSLNKFIDTQLDGIKTQLLAGKFDDALTALGVLGKDLNDTDTHQRARWHTQRAHCYWQKDEFGLAAAEFAAAYKLTPDDEKIASNAIRGYLLLEDYPAALTLGNELRHRFPASENVYTAWVQAADRNGQRPVWKTVPLEMRESADVLHVFAWLELLCGNHAEGARLAKAAQQKGDRSFEVSALRLLATVNHATEDGVLASSGIVAPEITRSLLEQIPSFEPADSVLWARQGTHSLSQVAACLGYAYMMTDQAAKAKTLLLEAVKRFPGNGQLGRICMESCFRTGSFDDAFKFGTENVGNLDAEGKLITAEMAARRGETDAFAFVAGALREEDKERQYEDDLRAFEWLLLAQHGKVGELAVALTVESAQQLTSIGAKVIALTLAKREQMQWADAAIEQFSKEITSTSSTRDAVLASQLFLFAKRYDDVVSSLHKRLPHGYFSEPHKLLFSALVQRGSRRRALQMLRSFPQDALKDAAVREDAVQLAQDAGDWEQLSTLAELHLSAHPERADAWGFAASVLIAQKRLGALRELLSRDIPAILDGPIRYRAQLARLEVEFGVKERGLRRLYHTYRCALSSAEAASNYLGQVLMMLPESLPSEPTVVSSGCAVTLEDADGTERTLVIDPDGLVGVPEVNNFIDTTSPIYVAVEGKRVGDDVEVTDGFGAKHRYTIAGMTSSYRRLAYSAQELIRTTVGNTGGLTSVNLVQGPDGEYDLSTIVEMLKQQSERVREVFAAYQRGPVTVGMVAKLLGTSAAVVSGDWPQSVEPNLYVCNGTAAERLAAETFLDASDQPLVIDLATVNELVAVDMEKVLSFGRPVFISTSASIALHSLMDQEQGNKAKANMAEQDGRIVLTQFDDAYHERRAAYLQRLRDCIDSYCQVVPVYGVDEPPQALLTLREHIDEESYDAVLLALEKNALLFTMDGRLREIAQVLGGIKGVWPQVLLSSAVKKGICTPGEFSKFSFTSLIKRRSHVSMSAIDFMWLLGQPWEFQTFAMRALLSYFASPSVDWRSVVSLICEVLNRATMQGATLAALCRIIETVCPPLFKREDVNGDNAHTAFALTVDAIGHTGFLPELAHPMEAGEIARHRANWLRILSRSVATARGLAQAHTLDELTVQPVDVTPLYISDVPRFIARNRVALPTDKSAT
ncbi:PIN domain-containing protein [Paraburkholderia tropica]|uniref:PIN domain-containing protein n=1 Tax=Paraburkholderia tropica TaxID=92647 RepID=UPI002AB74A71|nr:hypothetical protein [Paraburkholderia tropica]